MKRLKKIVIYLSIVILLGIVFRGFLYRALINYSQIKIRNTVELTDSELIEEINTELKGQTLTLDEIVDLSNTITSERLSFTFEKVSSDPNVVCSIEKGNCIGYSALFNSIGNYIVRKQKMTKTYQFRHLVGKLDILGYDIHKLINDPFFKDHDFNEIRDLKTGEKKFVDPSLRDYLAIEYVKSKD